MAQRGGKTMKFQCRVCEIPNASTPKGMCKECAEEKEGWRRWLSR